jgi:hypothetical protein
LDGFSWNLISENFFENLSRKFNFHCNQTRITGTVHEDQYTFLIISGWILLRIEMFQTKFVKKSKSTYFVE